MLESVKRKLRLSEAQEDGATLFEHLSKARDQFGIVDPLLEPIEVVPEVVYIEQLYKEISAGRPQGFGAARIPPTEYVAWEILWGIKLRPFEISVLNQMDDIHFEHANAVRNKDDKHGR